MWELDIKPNELLPAEAIVLMEAGLDEWFCTESAS